MDSDTEFRLIVEDCIAGMRALSAASVDLVVTSPPYNIGTAYGVYADRRCPGEYAEWTRAWVLEIKRILKPDGSFFLNVGATPRTPLFPHEMALRLAPLFVLQNTFHWVKSLALTTKSGETSSHGHFKPINSRRFVNDCHEFVFHFTQEGTTPLDRLALGVPYADKSNVRRWAHTGGRDLRCRGNVWFVPYQTIRMKRLHPATFPVELAENCIRIHGRPSETVMLDPYLGLGHSALAARRCGIRTFTGFDIDPRYVTLARQALELDQARSS